MDREMQDFLNGVVGVVEANSFETMCLWREYTEELKKPWKQRTDGLLETIGHVGKMPVCLCLNTAEIDGHKLLFIDATSQMVDYRLIDKWLSKMLPGIRRTNAMNFHNAFPHAAVAA